MQQLEATLVELPENAFGINAKKIYYHLSPSKLIQQTLDLNQGKLSDSGALCVNTGTFTGRSPKDKFIVRDELTEQTVDWNEINIGISPASFDRLYGKMLRYLEDKEVWIRDVQACANERYQLNIQIINEHPWANLFCNNLFIRQSIDSDNAFGEFWRIIQAPGFFADPKTDGTRQGNFTIVNFSKKIILIGGSAYTGEIKKGIFSVLNYLLPHKAGVLSMHCSANEGLDGNVALFFGLSGTGKTTLSAEPTRRLIGDDEHGWSNQDIFNFEGGCYAKCINLSEQKEPEIFQAIRYGTLLENVCFYPGTNRVNFEDGSITENTRAAYPINFIKNAKHPSCGRLPQNIFFLTCDAFGVLPPISKLTNGQAMYHFISGYTAKVAGTEVGITEPQSVFSACFGKVFLPLHPISYAELLGRKLSEHPQVNVWLINTGWIGGSFGVGQRIKLSYTRAMVNAAINGDLDNVSFSAHDIFGMLIPGSCPGVPDDILDPIQSWEDHQSYNQTARHLANLFIQNFDKYASRASKQILNAAPKLPSVS